PPPPPPPPPEPIVENFDTAEFRRSNGLSNINALAAFDAGGTGEGVIVGVIDTGIDREHPEFAGAISELSADVTLDRDTPTFDDSDGHGTIVSGIIAARRNDTGTLGVAFQSTILALRADDPGSCETEDGCSFFDRDIARGINQAVRDGARVINISLGGEGFGFSVLQAVRNAAANDVMVVISAGNDSEIDPSGFAFLADDPLTRDHVLVVGATNQFNALADFSNRAGQLAEFFLVAPGEDILAPFPQEQCEAGPGNCFARASGTSFAAPHVAGAVALLAQMFPNLSAAEIGQILRETALDLGATGVDGEFGNGLIDLAAALQPVGTTSIPTNATASRMLPTDGSAMTSSAAFGDAFSAARALDGVLMIDGFRRSFRLDLSQSIERAPAALALQSLVDRPRHLPGGDLAVGDVARFSFSAYDDRFAQARAALSPRAAALESPARPVAFLSGQINEKTRASLAYGLSPARVIKSGQGPDPAEDFALSARIDTPFLASAADQRTVAIHQRLSGMLSFDLAFVEGDGPDGNGGQSLSLDRLALDRRIDDPSGHRLALAQINLRFGGALIAVQAGTQAENGSFLGTQSEGAFALGTGANSQFLALDGRYAFSDRFEIFGRYLMGSSSLDQQGSGQQTSLGGSLFSGIDKVRTDSFAFGLRHAGLFHKGDRAGFAVIQPLRVRGGTASLRVPVARDFDQDIFLFEDRSLSLAPTGREIDLEFSYGLSLDHQTRIETSLVQQFEAGHVDQGASITSVLLRLHTRF
ncbi:S8 family peptidase, partial [Iodidimonas nitroreducens]|uniref:S8 family peptidase n=1 Tax=Iodidimonas nitroreducens TaxID=1236968 RepID=UPI0012310FAE